MQFLVIINYFLGKKDKESKLYALTQPERELLSNRYGTRTAQHMHDCFYCFSNAQCLAETELRMAHVSVRRSIQYKLAVFKSLIGANACVSRM